MSSYRQVIVPASHFEGGCPPSHRTGKSLPAMSSKTQNPVCHRTAKSFENGTLCSFYIQSFSLTECIVIDGVRKYRSCLCVCVSVCLSVCLCRAVSRNYWADFNETLQKWSPIGLVVRVCVSAH